MGSSRDPRDSKGRKKAQCLICSADEEKSAWFHRLNAHLQSFHDGERAYLDRFPEAKLKSAWARRVDSKRDDSPSEDMSFGVANLTLRKCSEADSEFVPAHDENWHVGPEEAAALEALALAIQDDENVLIVGPPGIGKSTLVLELAAITNNPVRRMPFRGDMRVSDLLGSKALDVDAQTGQAVTSYRAGILPDAISHGHWFHADEIDSAPAEVTFVLHPVLEERRSLVLTGRDEKRDMQFNPLFRFIATANTLGWGDETGLYAGTAPMNEAFLDRFGTVISLSYPSKHSEIDRIVKKSGIPSSIAKVMVEVACRIREAQVNNTATASLSPRRLIMWARKTVRMDMNTLKAARYTVTNRLPRDESEFVDGIIQRHFGTKV